MAAHRQMQYSAVSQHLAGLDTIHVSPVTQKNTILHSSVLHLTQELLTDPEPDSGQVVFVRVLVD